MNLVRLSLSLTLTPALILLLFRAHAFSWWRWRSGRVFFVLATTILHDYLKPLVRGSISKSLFLMLLLTTAANHVACCLKFILSLGCFFNTGRRSRSSSSRCCQRNGTSSPFIQVFDSRKHTLFYVFANMVATKRDPVFHAIMLILHEIGRERERETGEKNFWMQPLLLPLANLRLAAGF